MTDLSAALERLEKARAAHLSALTSYDALEASQGVASAEAEKYHDENIDPRCDATAKAERAVSAAEPRGAQQTLQKIAALLNEAMEAETVERLREDIAAALAPVDDPIVPLFERWQCFNELHRKALDACPTGNWEGPEIEEFQRELHRLEDEILRHTPVSAAGVAAVAEIHWTNHGPSLEEGSESWVKEMEASEYLPLRRIRVGAAIVASRA